MYEWDEYAALMTRADSRLLISRANDDKGKQDIFLGWMNNPALEPFKPFFGQIQQTLGPQSQQVSAQILDNVPGAKEVFEQISKWQEQFGSFASNFNPGQFIPGMPSGG